jgi:hypothetical protein
MSQRIASLYATIGVDNKDAKRGLAETKQGLAETGKEAKTTQVSLGKMAAGFSAAAAGVATAKKVFDFSKEGAQVLRMEESFSRLGISMSTLRIAAGGTVDDMTLMSSTAKLVAGTTGQLTEEMKRAAPELIKVARAAVQLDPTIGTVAETYQALATGIKKNQPLLIDNANIAVKVGTANEKMAESLGKTVNELTDEEKQIALLNETLRAGGVIIEQVGGIAEDAASDFDRLDASWANYTNSLKKSGSELSGVAGYTADFLDVSAEVANNTPKWTRYTGALGASYLFLSAAIQAANVESEREVPFLDSATLAIVRNTTAREDNVSSIEAQKDYTSALVESGQRWTDQIANSTEEQARLNKQLEEARSVYGDNSDEVRELEESLESLQKKNARFVAEWELAAMKRAGADEEAQLEFMRTMGLIDEGSIVGIQALEKLRDQKEEGVITTHQYNMMVDQLIKNITRLDGMTADAWIRMHYQGYGGSGLLAGGGFEGTKMKGSDLEGFLTNNYSGGALNSRGWTLVGDSPGGGWTPYAELVSPRGYVYSNKESEAIMKSGLLGNVPTRYIGGILESEVAPPPAGDTTPPPLPVLTSRSAIMERVYSSGSSSAETSAAAESVANSTETVVAGLVSSVSGLAEQTSSISAQALLASTKTGSAILKQTIEVQRSNRDMISRMDQIVANTERSPSRSDIKNAMSEAVQEAMAGSI